VRWAFSRDDWRRACEAGYFLGPNRCSFSLQQHRQNITQYSLQRR
jgi:hypothetical protein